MTDFLDDPEVNEAILSAKSAISGGSQDLTRDGISVAVSAAEMAYDPSGLAATEVAAEAMVLFLRASRKGIEDPMLKDFIEGLALAGELTAVLASVAKDASGIGVISAIGKELAMQATEGLGADALDSFNESVSKLPETAQVEISNATEEEMSESLAVAEERSNLKPSSLNQALNSRQKSGAEIGG